MIPLRMLFRRSFSYHSTPFLGLVSGRCGQSDQIKNTIIQCERGFHELVSSIFSIQRNKTKTKENNYVPKLMGSIEIVLCDLGIFREILYSLKSSAIVPDGVCPG